jgi:hypothetical protein
MVGWKSIALMAMIITLALAASIGGSYYLSAKAISNSDRKWCVALDVLTRHPTPQATQPSQQARKSLDQLYASLLDVRKSFGCD